ncbi:hypothetical protein [Ralstonia pickettii]|uniref:hypothetical protein n=1 Tax=Ralstonia pickettii TaxID=329 RepID=UPI002D780C98|nr:hypothetical protein [Ralstonia pickettii]
MDEVEIKKPEKVIKMNKWYIFLAMPPFTAYFVCFYIMMYMWLGMKSWISDSEEDTDKFLSHKKSEPILLVALILANALLLSLPQNHIANSSSYQLGQAMFKAGDWVKEDLSKGFKTDGL